MIARGVIALALFTYATVAAVALWPARAPAAEPAATPEVRDVSPRATTAPVGGLPFRSVGMQIQRVDWIDRYKQSIDEIAELGADTVLLVVDTRQETTRSTRIFLDARMTPTPEQLSELIRHAKAAGLRVIVMPVVLIDNPINTEWRGTISPDPERGGWEEWFNSYRNMITHFAWISQGAGADVLVVGSELVSTEDKADQWRQTIEQVRDVFKGQLTYSSNWDHYRAVPFWDQLDLIGMNSYWKLGKDRTATVEQIQKRWSEIQKDLLKFQAEQNRPLFFTEVGWCPLTNAAHEPWDYTKTEEAIDLDLQRRLYEGFFRAWHANPALGGFSIWEWTPGEGGADDRGYTPENKPAEQVLRAWLAKPRWETK